MKRKTASIISKKELEKKLDKIFSEFIRLRDADDKGYCQCITCGNFHYWRDIQCGHFIGRAKKAVRFNEMNCHSQCVRCNKYRSGEWLAYEERLVEIYGNEAVKGLKAKARIGGSHDVISMQMLIDEYKEKVKQMKKEKGL